jgi:malonyl-CoA O-methyltransferase
VNLLLRLRQRLRVLPSRAAYALWAERYPAEAHNLLMQLEQDAMLDLLPDVSGQHVLDAAGGTGRYNRILTARGARVVGCDHSLEMLLRSDGLVCGADLEQLPFADQSFDGVVCGLAIGHVRSLEGILREFGRVLKPNGWLLVSDLHPFQTLRGAQRTFTGADGRRYAVEHYLHTFEETVRVLRKVDFFLQAVREPKHSGWPVVLVWYARRASGSWSGSTPPRRSRSSAVG